MINSIVINNKIILKKLLIKDINQNYLNWFKDESVKKNIVNNSFITVRQLKKYFKKIKRKKNLIFFGIFYKNYHIGNLKFENIYDYSSEASFGILIGNKKFRVKKIGFKVLSKSIDYIINKFRIKKFTITSNHKNDNAISLYQKLGFNILKKNSKQIFLCRETLFSKIILGTANFQNVYGIRKKIIKKKEIKSILKNAKKYNIKYLDTASNYGQSESILGKSKINNFEIISKLPEINRNEKKIKLSLYKKLRETLQKTNKNYLYGYLVHEPKDLLTKNGKIIIRTLNEFKKKKLIKKIGISVYDVDDLKKIIKFFKPDIVQLPINILNQSFLRKNYLQKLKNIGIEIHARSIFLQGLLIGDNYKKFKFKKELKKKIDKIDFFCKKKSISRIQFLVNFIDQIYEVDKIVIGVDNTDQLKKIIYTLNILIPIKSFTTLAEKDKRIIDPRLWQKN